MMRPSGRGARSARTPTVLLSMLRFWLHQAGPRWAPGPYLHYVAALQSLGEFAQYADAAAFRVGAPAPQILRQRRNVAPIARSHVSQSVAKIAHLGQVSPRMYQRRKFGAGQWVQPAPSIGQRPSKPTHAATAEALLRKNRCDHAGRVVMQDPPVLHAQRSYRFQVGFLDVRAVPEGGRNPPHLCQAKPAQKTNHQPASIEFEPALRELG